MDTIKERIDFIIENYRQPVSKRTPEPITTNNILFQIRVWLIHAKRDGKTIENLLMELTSKPKDASGGEHKDEHT